MGERNHTGAGKVQVFSGNDTGQEWKGCLLQSLDILVLRQVECQQLCVSSVKPSFKPFPREINVLLLRLNTTEGYELWQLTSSSQQGVRAVAKLVF